MHMDQPLRPGSLVQIVNVLSNEQQPAGPLAIKPCERLMRVIGLHGPKLRPPRIVEAMHQPGIAPKRLGRRDVFDAVAFPQTVGPAEGCKTALSGYTCTGQNDDVANFHRFQLAGESQ